MSDEAKGMSGAELGGLCVNCERDEFGRALERGTWTAGDSCAVCARDGHFALPAPRAELVERGAIAVSSVSYRVTGDTVLLCDEHLHALGDEPRVSLRDFPSEIESI